MRVTSPTWSKAYTIFLGDPLTQNSLEEQVKAIIAEPLPSPRKQLTTISEMRDRYTDLLADFHCLSKDIYGIKPDFVACDFEHSTCSWTVVKQNQPHWQLKKGNTPTALTGPGGADHTLGNAQGQYLYMEATGIPAGQVMDLYSPILDAEEGFCLRFWYNMHGRDTGKLAVIAKDLTQNGHDRLLWLLNGNQGNGWKLAEVTVPDTWQYRRKMRLHIEATRGQGQASDIAIDDLSSEPRICIPGQFDCSFEDGNTCRWYQVNALDSMDWKILTGSTPTAGTGPSKAVHLSNGEPNSYYLFMNAATGVPMSRADLQSPILRLEQPVCLTFWFFMKGADVAELDVILLNRNTMQSSVLWSRTGDVHGQSNAWEKAEVTIRGPDPDTPVQVLFRAIRGDSLLGDIAIDVIHGLSGSCDQYISNGPISPAG